MLFAQLGFPKMRMNNFARTVREIGKLCPTGGGLPHVFFQMKSAYTFNIFD